MKGLGLIGLVAVAAAGTAWLWLADAPPVPRPPASRPPASRPAAAVLPATPAPAAAAEPLAPRFDVARVGARGMLVTAGRAAPGAEVTLLDSGRDIGRARSDGRGEWVILPADPLSPGLRELALLSRLPGAEPVPGRDTVLLLVPDPPVALAPGSAPAAAVPPAALAVLLPPTAAAAAGPRLLQAAPEPAADPARQRLGLDVVDYDEAGGMRFAGSAPPGSTVRVYVGREHAGDAVADPAGRWALSPATQPSFGRHTLRIDQLAAAGSVAARIELPFQRDRMQEEMLADGRLVVQPGTNLWRIARRVYGRGTRYTVIYQANREQIRDPNRIYPGQLFSLPEGPAEADSSRSR